MAVRSLTTSVERLRILLKQEETGTDAISCTVSSSTRTEAALGKALVQRHGAMVMGVCGRILHNSHDAEDAFQATFLVLVRKASTVRPKSLVGNWLYGVAYRTAQEARKSAAKRRMKEAGGGPELRRRTISRTISFPCWTKSRSGSGKIRAVIVHCDLEGKTRREVAEQFNWPEGNVAGRLAVARSMLAKRRLGMASVSPGALATVLSQNASACVSATVASATVKAATLFRAGQMTSGVISVEVPIDERSAENHVVKQTEDGIGNTGDDGNHLRWGNTADLDDVCGRTGRGSKEAQPKKQEKRTNGKDEVTDGEAEAKLRQAEAAFREAETKLRQAQARVPDAVAMLQLQELRDGLREQKADLLLLALELEKQKGRVRMSKERLEFVLKRVEGNEEDKKSLAVAMKKELDPLIEQTVHAAIRIENMRQSNDVMLGHCVIGKQGTHLQRLEQVKKEIKEQEDYCEWPAKTLERSRELFVAFRGGFGGEFKRAEWKDEDKKFLLDTLNKEMDPIIAKADEINRILGRVRVALLKSLEDEKEGAKKDK